MAERMTSRTLSWARRIGWLLLIWVLSVAALGVIAILFRLFMNLAGLTV